MYPLVLIKSFGKEKGVDIIKELLRANGDSIMDSINICLDSYDFKAHKLSVSTRYYKTPIFLFECNDLNAIPNAVKDKIEGSIFYFDANDLQFLSELKTLIKFIDDNDIGISALITRNLNENGLHGISYDQINRICKLDLNVIDLNLKSVNDEAVGFPEVLELLKNHIWSSVHISTHNSNKIYKLEENDAVNLEDDINEFEELLNKFQQFKDVSQTMCREEVLQNAENLADLFANMLNED